jgi:hypothetical protein
MESNQRKIQVDGHQHEGAMREGRTFFGGSPAQCRVNREPPGHITCGRSFSGKLQE